MYFSPRQLNGRSQPAVRKMLERMHNVQWDSYHDHFKHGALVKKRLTQKNVFNPYFG